jgi:hypothetical protein
MTTARERAQDFGEILRPRRLRLASRADAGAYHAAVRWPLLLAGRGRRHVRLRNASACA